MIANLNYNKTGSSGSIISTSNTCSPEMIGGCLVSNNIDTYCSSSISDLISQRDLTIFFRFILTTLTTPILISYGTLGSSCVFVSNLKNAISSERGSINLRHLTTPKNLVNDVK